MTRKDTVNVIEGTRQYSAQVSDRWMTRVTDVPSRSGGARLTWSMGNFVISACLPQVAE
jgi:hypothetical protein